MHLETERLYLREMNDTDFGSLYAILSDKRTIFPSKVDGAPLV